MKALTKAELETVTAALMNGPRRFYRSWESLLESLSTTLNRDVTWPDFKSIEDAMRERGYHLRVYIASPSRERPEMGWAPTPGIRAAARRRLAG